MIITKRNAYIALTGLALFGIFSPQPDPNPRQLQEEEIRRLGNSTPSPYHYDDNEFENRRNLGDSSGSHHYDANESEHKSLQNYPTPPPPVILSCAAGQQEWKVSWEADKFQAFTPEQVVTLTNGMQVTVKNYDTGASVTDQYSVLDIDEGQAVVLGTKTLIVEDAIISEGGQPPFYPVNHGTMEIEFPEDIEDLYVSVGDIDSTSEVSDCARIRMFDATGNTIPLKFATTGTIKNVEDYAFESVSSKSTNNPGYESSLYARANGTVRKIMLDQSSLAFEGSDMLGKISRRGVFPALDFVYCANATVPTSVPTLAPKEVQGDPLVMGLAGQVFKFDGRNGAWYSYASAPSFQWNMKFAQFEGCPRNSNKFTTGFGLSTFSDGQKGKNTKASHKIQVNVVNEHNTGIGCGYQSLKAKDYECLGAGSLAILIDGHKVSRGGNFQLEDGSGEVIAYNAIGACSRRSFDSEENLINHIGAISSHDRRLANHSSDDLFEILENNMGMVVDPVKCKAWVDERKEKGDIFERPGTWSTVLIKTEKISFHVEYKQEQERCNAHNLDVWISEVNEEVVEEEWEGVVGETKPPKYYESVVSPRTYLTRRQALKFTRDGDYELIGPFSVNCHGCVSRGKRGRFL